VRVVVEADGGARGNPGPAGYGAVVRDAASGDVLAERAEAIGEATNNVAEYGGLIAGLRAAAELGATEVEVRMDSRLVVEQMSGRWQIKHRGLRPLAAEAAGLVRRFARVTFTWVPRDQNRHADALANQAMDAAVGIDHADPAARWIASATATEDRVAAAQRSPTAGPVSWEPRPAGTATRLILVRHGETERNVEARYSGRDDVPLSSRGEAQAQVTGARIAAIAPAVAAVVSSPLSRARVTGEAVSVALGGVPVAVDDDLVECDFGAWEGLTFAQVREKWGPQLTEWLGDPTVAPPGGESFAAVATRTRRAVASITARHRGEQVVVVSHVSPLKLILRDALAATDAFLHRLYLDPTGLSIVDYWPDGGIAVRTVNDTSHL
jgi:broad specificity phosphatase PhoE/ribonuclease HI